MIDRESRDKLAEVLRQYVSGHITNFELDDLILNNSDAAVRMIKSSAWFLYDDLRTHKAIGKYKLNKENKHEISRWILFLQSDLEYQWKDCSLLTSILNIFTKGKYCQKREGNWDTWPFFNIKDFKSIRNNPRFLTGKINSCP